MYFSTSISYIITTDPSSFIGNDRNRTLPSSVKITEKMV